MLFVFLKIWFPNKANKIFYMLQGIYCVIKFGSLLYNVIHFIEIFVTLLMTPCSNTKTYDLVKVIVVFFLLYIANQYKIK